MLKKSLFVSLTLSLVLTACAPATATPDSIMDNPTEVMEEPTEVMVEKPTDAAPLEATATSETMSDPIPETPAWFDASFTDASSGQTFSINSFKGKVVLVETMAIWCTNCRQQQMQVIELHQQLGVRDDFVSVGLDIDLNENLADLKTYVESHGFHWMYGVTTPETAREIGNLYGDQFLNPPSVPMLIVDRQSQAHPLPFGLKSAEVLRQTLEPFLQAAM